MSKKARRSGRRAMTPRQVQILTRIRDSQRNLGYSPTMQELADEFGITKVTVFEHVEALIAKGMLRRSPHRARSLELTPGAALPDERAAVIPFVGRIAAGSPIDVIEQPETIDIDEILRGREERFVLQVQGDSMIDDHICDGDLVIAEKRSEVRNGDTVVAVLEGGEATLKKYYRERDGIRLQPANADYEPIYVKDVDIQGVVIGVVRRY
ncbi:MAG: transcriptional repressor LexA [Planctomycetes bacterium]|nr:transcriptional repressor LexA [Planctomycetota bacterium]